MRVYYRENTRVVEVPELTDHEGTPVTGATVEATITLEDGADVPGITNPVAMTDEGAGKYLGIIPPIEVEDGTIVILEVKADYAGVESTSRERFVVRDRGFSDSCGSF
ncbi:hypothetical protein ACJO2E_08600 [Marinobacter sp. M1N3S26]|uniref:hypothetical protein n=1 Tax=Marinobacter sp. M1N3S26 TaxID=3382299 RepID=UPI00387B3A8B